MDENGQYLSINYLALVLGRWKVVLASTALCALIGLALYLMLPKSYNSSVMLLVYPPNFKSAASISTKQALTVNSPQFSSAEAISELMSQTLPIETYRSIATSRDLLEAVREQLQLEDSTIEDLEKKCQIELTPLGSRSPQYGIQYSQTIELHASWSSPEIAAEIAQTWADLFKKRIDELSQAGLSETYALIESMWISTNDDLKKAEEALREFDATWDLELMTARRTARELELTKLEDSLVTIEIDLAKQRATLASLESDLGKEEKKEILFRAPSDDVYWMSKSGIGPQDTRAIDTTTGLRTEELNPNYLTTRMEVITASSSLRGLEEQKTNTIEKVAELQGEIETLDDEIVTRMTEQKSLSRDVATMERSFELAATALQKAKIASVNTTSDIRIVGNAVAPGRSSSTGGIPQIFVASLIGCLLGMAYVVVSFIVSQGQTDVANRVK